MIEAAWTIASIIHAYELCDDCRGFWSPEGDR